MKGTIMPLAKISILKGRSASDKKKLLDAVHLSLVGAFKIPDNDRTQRVYEFEHADFEIQDDRSDKYTIIEIIIFPGRSVEAKKKLYKQIFSHLKELGYQDNDATIVLHEQSLDNWRLRGGKSAREIDLGFSLDV
jgi:phenylpyruvate tautomerase PptA (4-oxalocrotonate tautomerase family)